MTVIKNDRLVIVIEDNEPCDRLKWIVKAIAAGLRHYAANANKRNEDHEHAEVMSDLLLELAEVEKES